MAETWQTWFAGALACATREEATAWLLAEIDRTMDDPKWVADCLAAEQLPTAETARQLIRRNLGYLAGYYDQATSQKVHDLFDADHPVFGGPDYWTRVTFEEALRKGRELGDRMRRGEALRRWGPDAR
jgi:hypothetical protein